MKTASNLPRTDAVSALKKEEWGYSYECRLFLVIIRKTRRRGSQGYVTTRAAYEEYWEGLAGSECDAVREAIRIHYPGLFREKFPKHYQQLVQEAEERRKEKEELTKKERGFFGNLFRSRDRSIA